MFGSRHLPASKIFFRFSGNFGAEGQAFLKWLHNVSDDADMTYIFKDKGKLNRIIKNHPIALVTFSLKYSSFLQILSLGKRRFYCLRGIKITTGDLWNQRKKPVKTNLIIIKNGGNEHIACYAPEILSFLAVMTKEWHCIFDTFFSLAH